jgi:hypothetical protein
MKRKRSFVVKMIASLDTALSLYVIAFDWPSNDRMIRNSALKLKSSMHSSKRPLLLVMRLSVLSL